MRGTLKSLGYDFDGNLVVTATVPASAADVPALSKLLNADVDIDVKKHREKRSLDANALFWKLLQGLAEAMEISKDDAYLKMLESYGHYDFIIVRPEAVDFTRTLFRIVKDFGTLNINGRPGTQLQVWVGSSQYDTAQMSRLIAGTIAECEALECWTPNPEEINGSLLLWGERNGA